MTSIYDRSSEENKESVTLIWFDSMTGGKTDTASTMKTLRAINDYVLFHTDLEQCISYIKSINNEKIFLITSGLWASSLLPTVINLGQIEVVFIFCTWREQYLYLVEQYSKVSGVYVNQDELGSSIRHYLHLCNKQVETFSFYDQKQRASINLSERAAEFLW